MKKLVTLLLCLSILLSAMIMPAMADELEGEIVFWHSFSQGPRLETIQKAADDFMAANPKVKITIETFSWGDFYTKWTTGFSSGNLPDMSSALPNHVVEMIDYDAIIPMDPLIDEIGRDRFNPAPLLEMTKDGVCYAVPLYSHAQVMWYRKDLLEKYDLEVPKTWDELKVAADTITKGENGEVYGCSVPFGIGDLMATRYLNFYVRSAGETLLTEDGKANITSQAAIDGIKYWVQMYKDNSPADSINFKVLDQATLYYQGKNAFDFNSGFQIGGVEANSPQLLDYIDCAPMPKLTVDSEILGNETSNIPMVIWKNSKNPQICEAFIKFLYQDDYYIPFLHSVPVGMLSAFVDTASNPAYLANEKVQKYQHAMEVISTTMQSGTAIGMEYGPKPQAGLLTSQNVIETMFQNIIINNVDVETAAQEAEDTLNELFETLN
ncbi:MAG: sugar ABC transporter substrate-binding protein [Christensenellaceae bacterium]|nr:sugar ABC transporter substrate-binding protein [Christensenellaceae bacterium]